MTQRIYIIYINIYIIYIFKSVKKKISGWGFSRSETPPKERGIHEKKYKNL